MDVFNLPNHSPPARVYIHENTLALMDENLSVFENGRKSLDYFLRSVDVLKTLASAVKVSGEEQSGFLHSVSQYSLLDSAYLISSVQVEKNIPKITILGYNLLDGWKGDIRMRGCEFNLNSANSISYSEQISLTSNLITLLGIEEQYRRTTQDLTEYINGKFGDISRNEFDKSLLATRRIISRTIQEVKDELMLN